MNLALIQREPATHGEAFNRNNAFVCLSHVNVCVYELFDADARSSSHRSNVDVLTVYDFVKLFFKFHIYSYSSN